MQQNSLYLAWISGVEVLIGGDFNLPDKQIPKLLAEHNKLVEQNIDKVFPIFREMGLMDCMIENVNRPERRLRQLKLHVVSRWSTRNTHLRLDWTVLHGSWLSHCHRCTSSGKF
jgi:aspartokinase-like uncharacterized kinase